MVSAQNQHGSNTPDPRLLDVFSKQEISDMQSKEPYKIAWLNYSLEHAFYISDEPQGPIQKIKNVSLRNNFSAYFNENVNTISNNTFNYLKYNFKLDNQHYNSYDLGNGKYLVFYPVSVTESNFKSIKNK